MVGWAAESRNPAGPQDDDSVADNGGKSLAITTDVSANSMRTVKNFQLPFGSGYYVPERYAIPTHLLREMFRTIDRRDSPAQPGRLKYSTAVYAINHFHGVFSETGKWCCPNCGEKQFRLNSNCRNCNAPLPAEHPGRSTKLNSDVAASLHRLASQAERHQRRVSSRNLDEVTLRWNQGDVLNCFQVELNLKERIFFTFDISENSTFCSKSVSWIMMLAVVISIMTFIISTLPSADDVFGGWVPWVDVACVTIFTVDYLTRLLTVSFARTELLNRYFIEAAISGHEEISLMSASSRLRRFIISPMAIVDLISVIPFWIEFAIVGPDNLFKTDSDDDSESSGVLRVFRVIRIIRVFKLGTLAKADLGEDNNMVLNLFGEVVGKARPALQLVLVLVIMAMLVFGTLVWFTERGTLFKLNDPDCPHPGLCSSGSIRVRKLTDGSYEESASPFESIPLSFWWVVVTITTVGYGDYFPVTTWGLPIGGITIFYGVVVFALPVGIIGSTFGQAYDNFLEEQRVRKALETENQQKESGQRAGLTDKAAPDTFDSREPPPLVEELLMALKQTSVAAQLREDMLKRWEAGLRTVTKFEHFTEEHPCEALERWGQPVLATLSESVENIPLAQKFFAQTRGAWYRLLLHAAQAYEDFQESLRPAEFVAAMHGPLRQGSVKLSVDPKLLEKASASFGRSSSSLGKGMAARSGSNIQALVADTKEMI